MIPKVMNFFWAGEKISWLRYMSVYSFCKLNPDWKVRFFHSTNFSITKVWNDVDVIQDFSFYEGKNYLPEIKKLPINFIEISGDHNLNPVYQADLFRWRLLATEGGFYSDTDVLFIQPMNIVHSDMYKADVVYSVFKELFFIGFLGAIPNNRFFATILQKCQSADVTRYQGMGLWVFYSIIEDLRKSNWKEYSISLLMRLLFRELIFYELFREQISPWDGFNVDPLFTYVNKIPYNCFVLHWYGSTKIANKFNSLLNPDNYELYPCTLTRCLHGILTGQMRLFLDYEVESVLSYIPEQVNHVVKTESRVKRRRKKVVSTKSSNRKQKNARNSSQRIFLRKPR